VAVGGSNGSSTPSILSMIPLQARMSTVNSVASFIVIIPLFIATITSSPCSVSTGPGNRAVDKIAPGSMWYRRTCCRTFGLARRYSRNAGSSIANASFVGMAAVKGPSQRKISSIPAWSTRDTNVERSLSFRAVSRRFGLHNAPPSWSCRPKGRLFLLKINMSQISGSTGSVMSIKREICKRGKCTSARRSSRATYRMTAARGLRRQHG
jgi:hypothetical protein